jgi:hypothetical protein
MLGYRRSSRIAKFATVRMNGSCVNHGSGRDLGSLRQVNAGSTLELETATHHLYAARSRPTTLLLHKDNPDQRKPKSDPFDFLHQHHVGAFQQHPHEYYVTVPKPPATAPQQRSRRRHRRRLPYLASPPRILHRKGATIPPMAPSRPKGPAGSSHAVRILATATAHGRTRWRTE